MLYHKKDVPPAKAVVMEWEFVLLVSTGLFHQCSVEDISAMRKRLREMFQRLPVARVVFGWGKNIADV